MFRDRADAGRQLAAVLSAYRNRNDVVVLGLPRGGVPVAFEVAKELHLPMDALLVRKLGVPTQPELAFGAVAFGGVESLNKDIIDSFSLDDDTINSVKKKQIAEIERRNELYRSGRQAPDIKDKAVILVDDGIATGATMHAAIQALGKGGAREVIVAVPVASSSANVEFEGDADKFLVLQTPKPFLSVGQGYRDFSQTTDREVREMLEQAKRWHAEGLHNYA